LAGATIVKQMVTRLGGEVGFDDAPGGGTIFYVDFPDAEPVDTIEPGPAVLGTATAPRFPQ
jgi:hypothetical protein